ncbi:MAG TPA: glycosyltransferase family 4 protein [Candidatus Kapabacteria bacterium]|nr:glycosyltransferase family 4 protein [Candidatus Kapabacteria bacterium]
MTVHARHSPLATRRSKGRLAIVTQDPANYGGVLRLAEYLYRRSEAIGLEPTLLHYGRYDAHADLHASFANVLRGEINLVPKTTSYTFRGMSALAIGATLPEWEPNRLRSNKAWRQALAEFDAWLLVTGSAQTGLPLVQCGKPFVAWISSTVAHDRRSRLVQATVTNWIERLGLHSILRAEKQVLVGASRLLAVSDDTAHHVAASAEKKVEVWPYPVDTSKFQPSGGGETPDRLHRFLFVGRANDPRKRVELFLAACEELQRIRPDLPFEGTVVSVDLPIRANPAFTIQHIARAGQGELIALYRASTALVVTSEQEGLGIAAMEAMACGLPVISTRCGGPETFLEDGKNGFLVEDTPPAIARRMNELSSDDALRREFGAAARERIEMNFSEQVWNPRFEEMLQKYAEIS